MMSDSDVMLVDSDSGGDSDFEIEPLSVRLQKAKSGSKATVAAPVAKKVVPKKAPAKLKGINSNYGIENAVPKEAKAPSKKKVGTATSKKSMKEPLAERSNSTFDKEEEEMATDLEMFSHKNGSDDKKTVEERYQKKTQLEHILLRPDTYIGSVKTVTQPMFVRCSETANVIEREVTFVPGLFKIFDEIVVNAADNKQRDPSMDKLDIVIDAASNTISVQNNGDTIPIQIHKEHNCYVPTLIFGHLLTGSNFDDNEKKTTGGRNGYGAKLANIFSTEFVVECTDTKNKLKFHQVFRNNMSVAEKPSVLEIKSSSILKAGDKTKITFKPDLEKFNMSCLDKDTVDLLSKRAYDIAAAMSNAHGKKLIVSLNGENLKIKNFKEYIAMYTSLSPPVVLEKINERWEVGVGPAPDGTFHQISFVNSICTYKGGQHVNYVADKVAARLVEILKKKNKGGVELKPAQVKNHLSIFVNCLIENPTFDSQTKEFLTSRPKEFGSDCVLPDSFMKKIEKSEVVENILSFVRFKQNQDLNKKGGTKKKKLTGISKLDDANFAGSAKSNLCTLILTEGDSAKSLAMSGISVVGRDYYGCFPLKGKLLNVRDAAHKVIMNNEEIKNLVDIIGLKFNQKYDKDSIKTLRYGHVMIMADQDSDGSHIVGLLINLVHHFWPSLLHIEGFLQRFITPIVRVTKAKKSKAFFTLPEYETWKEANGEGKGWTTKYYKGLGTSTSNEAKDYFSNLDKHELNFADLSEDIRNLSLGDDDEPGEDVAMVFDESRPGVIPSKPISGNDLIDMAFSKNRVEDRKVWLNSIDPDVFLDYAEAKKSGGIQYSDFVNKELILFSKADNIRSIPHLIDGFKPSQRKVMFSCFKRKLKDEFKVAQLAGYVGEHSAYHHGEASLAGTIIGLAQSFCGSNNINFLSPCGQFGTRRMGGKDNASPRYIYTKLEKITRTIFHPDDDALLTYLNDDGISIEPEFYVPVIPVILVNGADGIGTGWSSKIPNYDPRTIIGNIRKKINGESYDIMHPHYYGFTGEIIVDRTKTDKNYTCAGKIQRIDDTTLEITELPLKFWTQDYKEFLEKMLVGDKEKKIESEILDFKENHTDDTVAFTIYATKEKIDEFEQSKAGLLGKFKLTGTFTTSNMHLFDANSRISKYGSPEEILDAFHVVRLEFYSKRKALLLKNLRQEQLVLSNKARFVEEVCKGKLVVSNRKRTEILSDLQRRGYDLVDKAKKAVKDDDDEEALDEDATDAQLAKGFDYLLGMKIWNLTMEKVLQLQNELAEKVRAVDELEKRSPTDIWQEDLRAIELALDERDLEKAAALGEERQAQLKSQKHQKQKATKAPAKPRVQKKLVVAKKSSEDSADDSIDFSDSDLDFAPTSKQPMKKSEPKKAASKLVVKSNAVEQKAPPVPPAASRHQDEVKPKFEGPTEDKNFKKAVKAAVATKKRPSSKDLVAEDEFGFESSSSENGKFIVEMKKPRKGNEKPKIKKAVAAAKPQEMLVDTSESEDDFAPDVSLPKKGAQAASRPQRSRAAASKVNYAIDVSSDSEEEAVLDSESETSDDEEDDFD